MNLQHKLSVLTHFLCILVTLFYLKGYNNLYFYKLSDVTRLNRRRILNNLKIFQRDWGVGEKRKKKKEKEIETNIWIIQTNKILNEISEIWKNQEKIEA